MLPATALPNMQFSTRDVTETRPGMDAAALLALLALLPSLSRFHCISNTSFATGGGMMAHASILWACTALSVLFRSRYIRRHAFKVTPTLVASA